MFQARNKGKRDNSRTAAMTIPMRNQIGGNKPLSGLLPLQAIPLPKRPRQHEHDPSRPPTRRFKRASGQICMTTPRPSGQDCAPPHGEPLKRADMSRLALRRNAPPEGTCGGAPSEAKRPAKCVCRARAQLSMHPRCTLECLPQAPIDLPSFGASRARGGRLSLERQPERARPIGASPCPSSADPQGVRRTCVGTPCLARPSARHNSVRLQRWRRGEGPNFEAMRIGTILERSISITQNSNPKFDTKVLSPGPLSPKQAPPDATETMQTRPWVGPRLGAPSAPRARSAWRPSTANIAGLSRMAWRATEARGPVAFGVAARRPPPSDLRRRSAGTEATCACTGLADAAHTLPPPSCHPETAASPIPTSSLATLLSASQRSPPSREWRQEADRSYKCHAMSCSAN